MKEINLDQVFADLGSLYDLPADEVHARITRDLAPPHGYVVVDIDADTEDEWDSYDMAVRDTTVYPDLSLAQGEGIHEHPRNGLVETVRSSPSGTRLIRRIYALIPADAKEAE